jgi:HK97 gp10 family phage protein
VKVSIRVEGLKECEQALEDIMNTLAVSRATGVNTVKRALIYAVEPVQRAAAASAPVRRGRLKTSVTTGTKLSKRQKSLHKQESPVEVFVGAGPLPQAHLQEFGSARHPPQRFLTPAVAQNIRNVTNRFVVKLREEISKTAERARRKAARLLAQKG